MSSEAKLNEEIILSRCDFFKTVQLWPFGLKLNAEGWLNNFKETEKVHAMYLLSAFIYFSDELTKVVFSTAFNNLSKIVVKRKDSYKSAKIEWDRFRNNLIICRITGETPSDTDSGFKYARLARDLLRIDEGNILPPKEALNELYNDPSRPIVFVDDFLGSGEQVIETWKRKYQISNSSDDRSFEDIASIKTITAHYCPLISTLYGKDRVNRSCHNLDIQPAYLLDNSHSALSKNSTIWPSNLKKGAYNFLYEASIRAGIPQDNSPQDWRGFHSMGLTIAFYDSIPDATLPVYSWDKNGWTPLIQIP